MALYTDRWKLAVAELDAKHAQDSDYRMIMSTGSKGSLRRGETWRERVLANIARVERKQGENQ